MIGVVDNINDKYNDILNIEYFLLRRYVSRVNPKDNTRHVILGTQPSKPREFAAQMNLLISNGWGIVRTIIDICMKLPEGRYVLIKDPNKVSYTLFTFMLIYLNHKNKEGGG